MSNLAEDHGQGSSTSTARTEQMTTVLRTKHIVKLTNLQLRIPVKGLEVKRFTLLQKQQNWMLSGYILMDIHHQFFLHLILRLSAGGLEDSVKLVAELKHFPTRGYETPCSLGDLAVADLIKSFVCTISLLENDAKSIGDTICFQFAKKLDKMKERYFYCNDNFCSQSALKDAYQVSPEGASTVLGTSSAFEFVDVKLETTIRIKENTKDSLFTTRVFALQQSSTSKEYPSSKTDLISERPLNFTEIVVLKAGDGSQEKFYVHKNKLIQESPVFARMFEVSMSEKTTGEVTLDDCTAPELEAFIGFLYKNGYESRRDERVDSLLSVLALAHQHDTSRVVRHVKEMIISVENELMNLELALRIYAAGHLYEMPDLKFRAVQWMKCNKAQLQTEEGKKQVQAVIEANKDLGTSIMAEILTGL